ncbi:hypothetical protein [uncultured Psychroserpens sp.]|uniref:hypothetical protein n=1 Tax=uncultured Psychroserpens sp. TaxID=255436 RepID=UPI002622F12A|nr:hypothetical protein [uncultured Psychroserpens sp.]
MDELDLLKKDWQSKNTSKEQQFSSKDIYPMLLKKSSSIVKTLYYISIAELVFWIVINSVPYFSSEKYREDIEAIYGNSATVLIITILSIAIVILFVYLLYKSYKSISVTDSAKQLMESILKTRKVIKYYVIYNLVVAFLSMAFGLYYTVYRNPDIAPQFAEFSDKQMLITLLIMILVIAAFVFVFWVIYQLIYGILLRRLNRNYNELKKLEA